MRDGYWINYATGHVEAISEHQTDLRRWEVAERLGVSEGVHEALLGIGDRTAFLLHAYEHAPLMRVRGHGLYCTFEFNCPAPEAPYREILRFAGKILGPAMLLRVVNFAEKPVAALQVFPHQLAEITRRAAGVKKKVAKTARENRRKNSSSGRGGRRLEKRSFSLTGAT